MFWELAPEDVIGKAAELNCTKIEREWKRRKNKMEKAPRRSWTANENLPRAVQLREYTLKEFWEIFVDDRFFGAEPLFRRVNVQSKAVFSYAMTMMDATCMWIYTKEVLTKEQIPSPAMEEYLKKRMLSIMLCTNWVCAGTFVDHEWVSESTISNMRKKCGAWNWIMGLMFRAWYNGAHRGFQHLQD